jgi:hypothetical protein
LDILAPASVVRWSMNVVSSSVARSRVLRSSGLYPSAATPSTNRWRDESTFRSGCGVVLYQRAGGGKVVAPGKQTWSVNERDIYVKVKYRYIPKRVSWTGPKRPVHRGVHGRIRVLESEVLHYQVRLRLELCIAVKLVNMYVSEPVASLVPYRPFPTCRTGSICSSK